METFTNPCVAFGNALGGKKMSHRHRVLLNVAALHLVPIVLVKSWPSVLMKPSSVMSSDATDRLICSDRHTIGLWIG